MHDVRRDYELSYLVALLLVWGLFEFGVNWMMVKCGAMRMGGASCAISAYHHAVSACYMHPLLELAMGA